MLAKNEWQWRSYDNAAAILNDRLDRVFDWQCTATIKFDGSNIAIHVSKGEPITIYGRNSPIWQLKDGKQKLNYGIVYGNVGNMGKMPLMMIDFANKLCEILNCEDIIIWGESYNPGKNYSSWHPFGYAVFSENWKRYLLTEDVWKLFNKISNVPEFNSIEELFKILKNAKEHYIFPPPILFRGVFKDFLPDLFKVLKESTLDEFEGVVIATDHGKEFKLKTPKFEEQPKVPQTIPFIEQKSHELYELIITLHSMKPPKVKKTDKPPKIHKIREYEDELVRELVKELENAIKHELGTRNCFEHIPKIKRKILVDKLMPNEIDDGPIIKELESHYIKSETELPWDRAQILNIIKAVLMRVIMEFPYKENNSLNIDEAIKLW
jgi:hypothetical protein